MRVRLPVALLGDENIPKVLEELVDREVSPHR